MRARSLLSLLPILLSLSSLSSCSGSISVDTSWPEQKSEDNNYRNYYEIFVGSYADSDGDGMGDLQGVISKLDYIADMGFDGIWLMPIFESPSYHKYDCSDYFTIDPDYGTEDDLKQLVSEAHERGIKVILDLALNHSSPRNETFILSQAAYAWTRGQDTASDRELLSEAGLLDSREKIEAQAEMYVFVDDTSGYSGRTFYQASGRDFYYEGNFSSDMPEFNFDSEVAQDYFKSVIQYWMDEEHGDVDGYRLDAVKYYYYTESAARNGAALDQLEEYGKEVDPNCYFVGECYDNASTITSYYENSDLDSFFWFPAQGSNGFIRSSLGFGGTSKSYLYTSQVTMVEAAGDNIPAPFLDNHDVVRCTQSNLVNGKFQYGLLASLTGNTFTYYGDECGISQAGTTDDESKRTHMEWGDGMECDDPENATASTYVYGTVEEQLKDSDSMIAYVTEANRLRNKYPAFGWGTPVAAEYTTGEAGIMTIDKELDDQRVRIVYNYDSSGTQEYVPDEGETLVGYLLSQGKLTRNSSGDGYLIPGYSIALFEIN